jgi:hypothetical protein
MVINGITIHSINGHIKLTLFAGKGWYRAITAGIPWIDLRKNHRRSTENLGVLDIFSPKKIFSEDFPENQLWEWMISGSRIVD